MTVEDLGWRGREMESRRRVLRARGVPEAFVEPIATRGDNVATYAGGLVVLVPLLASIGLAWLGFEAYGRFRAASASAFAHANGAWLWASDGAAGWIGVIGLLFAIIGGNGWLYALLTLRLRPHPAPSLAASMLREEGAGQGKPISDALLRRSVARAAPGARSADDLLLAVARDQRRLWSGFTLLIAIPSMAFALAGSNSGWAAGPLGVVRHGLTSEHRYAWVTARSVTLGCNETKDDHALEYAVAFPGWTAELGPAGDQQGGRTLPEATWISGLAKTDGLLRYLKTPRRRWSWLDRDPMHPACLAYWRAVADTVQPGALDRLLSVTP
jgi:hypothetical protein